MTVATATARALKLRDQADGHQVYVVILSWALAGSLAAIGELNKPTVVAEGFLGGSGTFLTSVPPLVRLFNKTDFSQNCRRGYSP